MLRIPCPECGARELNEFRYGGEAARQEPPDKFESSDADWSDYLFMRSNTRGLQFERWQHAHGCRRWFHVLRHTVSDRILAVYRLSEPLPELGEAANSELVAITSPSEAASLAGRQADSTDAHHDAASRRRDEVE